MKSASKVVPFPAGKAPVRGRDEIAFLPAALEIAEAPPNPVGRAVGAVIVATFAVAIVWACVGTVDIVAVAPGKVIPSGRTKVIQPFEISVVRAIHVADGQIVRAGDVLVDLDSTMNEAEIGHLKSDLVGAQIEAARLRAALAGGGDPVASFHPPEGAPAELVKVQQRFLANQSAEQIAKLATIEHQVAQKEAERATIMATIGKLETTIPLLQQRVDMRKQLFDKELGSKIFYLQELQDLVGQQQEIVVQRSRSREAEAALAALVETGTKTSAEYQRSLSDDLAKAEQKAAGLVQDIVKAEQRRSFQRLTAPIDGVIQQLVIHTVGGVVTPAQSLMVIVPLESRLEIEAIVSNRDIGFVEVGQEAAIKIDTFNFTRYGLVDGRVTSVSRDAITREKATTKNGDKSQGTEQDSSEPNGQELVYAARISPAKDRMLIDDKYVNISPGMAVTIEIKTGTRSVISYLLSPLARYRHESMRER